MELESALQCEEMRLRTLLKRKLKVRLEAMYDPPVFLRWKLEILI